MTIENNLYKSYCTEIIAKQKLKVYQLLLNNSLILFFPSPLQRQNTVVSLSSNKVFSKSGQNYLALTPNPSPTVEGSVFS
ncbi:hypothetical protein CSQ80_02310 [Cyanobacterium aponinum IPPAS B-1201]|nr:hypothetical protein CSQ80_02310 [Cyanobacterium aponinum IPPAS B-1201]